MIEFYGELSEDCKKYMLKRDAKVAFYVGLVVAIIFIIPIIILAILWDWIFVIALPVLVAFPFLAAVRPSKKNLGIIFPNKITINEDVMTSESDKFSLKRLISQVKMVVDMGDWYDIKFFYPYRNLRFVCQKNLLVQGTIEEFEKLFEDKLIRK